MIQNTFIFIPGIGTKTEESYWEEGIIHWDDLKEKVCLHGTNKSKRTVILDYIDKAKEALAKKDISFFVDHLPQKEYWRLYKAFFDKTLFLDIETTGLSLYYDVITLIGAFDGKEIKLFVKDNNLHEISEHIKKYNIIITFNGTLFDIPFLRNQFPDIHIPPIHIDLRYLFKRLGLSGSLKGIERKVGLKRNNEIDKINGREAAILWSKFIKEDDNSLSKLVLYNIYDTTNLKTLMDYCYERKIKKEVLPKIRRNQNQQKLFKRTESIEIDSTPPISNFEVPDITLKRIKDTIEIMGNKKALLKVTKEKITKPDIKLNELIDKIARKGFKPLSVGIDLTGSESKASGLCVLDGEKAYLSLIKSDAEIILKTLDTNPSVISIDSPLSIPKGRDCPNDSCECRKHGITRECERILKRRGINVYPCLIQSMQKLTMRGIKLSNAFEEQGLQVIESYPGAAQDILGFPRKRVDLKELEIDLMNMGIKPFSDKEIISHDELDALTSALVGYFYLAGMDEAIGNLEEKYLIIPDLKRK